MSEDLDRVRKSHPGYDWFEIDVHLRRAADGEVRVCRDRAIRDGWKFQWSDGNYGCDCNRYLYFERAGGVEPPDDDDRPCTEGQYVIDRIVDVATGHVLCEGEP